jgi:ubiquinone/menaquinone biosynthesis C-methylase UbiE
MCRLFDNLSFRIKSCFLMFRGLLSPPIDSLIGANIRPGFNILDYGCGSGGYAITAAKIVGNKGKVYALDTNPSAIDIVQKLATRKGLNNIQTILSDGSTGLKNASVDVVLLHELSYPDVALQEIHRVLRSDGVLHFSNHQILIRNDKIVSRLTNSGLFRLSRKGLKTFNLVKTGWRRED